MLFYKLAASAGNTAMANTIDPMFMSFPEARGTSFGTEAYVTDVFPVESNKVYAVAFQAGTQYASVYYLSAGENNSPNLQYITSTSLNQFQPFCAYGSTSYFNTKLISNSSEGIKAGQLSPNPDPLGGSYSTLNTAKNTDPTGTTNSDVKYIVSIVNSSGATDTYFLGNHATGPSLWIQKNTNGTRQWAKRVYGSTALSISNVFPMTNGQCFLVTSRGSILLNSSGLQLYSWGNASYSPRLEDQRAAIDPTNTYIYWVDGTSLARYTLTTSTPQYINLNGAYSSIKTSGTGGNPFPSVPRACKVAFDKNGNAWVVNSSSTSVQDTIACFNSSWTFVRKYTFSQTDPSAYRAYITSISIDDDYLMVVGNNQYYNDGTAYSSGTFIAKLALDGSSTGTVTSFNTGLLVTNVTIDIQSSTSQGGTTPSWSSWSPTSYGFSVQDLPTYNCTTTLVTTAAVSNKNGATVYAL